MAIRPERRLRSFGPEDRHGAIAFFNATSSCRSSFRRTPPGLKSTRIDQIDHQASQLAHLDFDTTEHRVSFVERSTFVTTRRAT